MSQTPEDPSSAYSSAGVDYDALDAGKRSALTAPWPLPRCSARRGPRIDSSRGEPAFVFESGGQTLAFVLECLGTKSLIARRLERQLGAELRRRRLRHRRRGRQRPLLRRGAPLVVNAYFATGRRTGTRAGRHEALLEGWAQACVDAGCAGAAENLRRCRALSPRTRSSLPARGRARAAGSSAAARRRARARGRDRARTPSGLHANGASLARMIAAELPGGYGTASERPHVRRGAARPQRDLLGLVERCSPRLPIHYLSHITGHGLLKLMRRTAS